MRKICALRTKELVVQFLALDVVLRLEDLASCGFGFFLTFTAIGCLDQVVMGLQEFVQSFVLLRNIFEDWQ